MKKLVVNEKAYCRYEANIADGKLIVYFKDSNELYELPYPYYFYLSFLQKECLQDLYDFFNRVNHSSVDFLTDFKTIESNLLNLGILKYEQK